MQLSEDLQLNKKNLYQTVNQKKTRFLEVMDKRIVYKFFKDFTHNIKKIQNWGKRWDFPTIWKTIDFFKQIFKRSECAWKFRFQFL